MTSPLRAAVIGYGFAGRSFHAYLVGLTPGLTLHGIAARSAQTRAKIEARGDCRAYESFDEVLQDSAVDLVIIATSNELHAPFAIRALQAGKHVVVDKPMCLNLEECDAMLAAAQRSGKLLTAFHNRRWDGDFLTVQRLMQDGTLGEVRWMEMAWQSFGAPGSWRGGPPSTGGGRFYDLGAHLVDQLLQLFPARVTGVFCRMQHDFEGREVESEAFILAAFEDGRTGICDVSSLCALPKPRFHLHGSRATFMKYGVDPQEAAMIAGNIDAAREDEAKYGRLHDGTAETVVPTLPGRWRSFYENVAEAMAGREELMVKPAEVRRAIALLDAAGQSARTGEIVRGII